MGDRPRRYRPESESNRILIPDSLQLSLQRDPPSGIKAVHPAGPAPSAPPVNAPSVTHLCTQAQGLQFIQANRGTPGFASPLVRTHEALMAAQYITLDEAAKRLGIPVEEFKRRLKMEWTHLVPMRDGPTLRFRENQIEELAGNSAPPAIPNCPSLRWPESTEHGSDDFKVEPKG